MMMVYNLRNAIFEVCFNKISIDVYIVYTFGTKLLSTKPNVFFFEN